MIYATVDPVTLEFRAGRTTKSPDEVKLDYPYYVNRSGGRFPVFSKMLMYFTDREDPDYMKARLLYFLAKRAHKDYKDLIQTELCYVDKLLNKGRDIDSWHLHISTKRPLGNINKDNGFPNRGRAEGGRIWGAKGTR